MPVLDAILSMRFFTWLGLLAAALLVQVQFARAFTVTVTQVSCLYLNFALAVTTPESSVASALGLFPGPNNNTEISQVAFNDVYESTNTYTFYSPFFTPITQSGLQQITFRLLDENGDVLPAYPPVTQPITFQCGTTITTSSAASSSPTSASGSNSGGSSSDSNSSTSSGSSTGAIAGGVVGGVVALLALALLAFCLMRRKKKQRAQQSRLRNDEVDEAAFRAPNNDSTTSLATAPETANTPMMRDISTKNVFADPTNSTASGAASGSSNLLSANNQAASKPGYTLGAAGAGAAAAGGIGAAAIAARKQSREQSRAASPAGRASLSSPSSESLNKNVPSSQSPPPVPALPASAAYRNAAATSQPASKDSAPATYPSTTTSMESAQKSSVADAAAASAAAAAAGATANMASSDSKDKDSKGKNGSKWGFKRASKDIGNTSKPPYPQAVAEPVAAAAPASVSVPAPVTSLTPSPLSSSPSEAPASPSRSFKVIQKQPAGAPVVAPASAAGPSSASIAPSENSLNRTPVLPTRSGHATPAGSIRGNNYSRAPSVASMSAGFADAPPLPSGAASVSSMPTSEFGGNMAGVGAGRAFAASSGNSTKWHQQSYNVMPNFSHRALARSTQLDEDLIFGHLGMGLTPPPGPAGNGSESGSSKSRTDPFGDR